MGMRIWLASAVVVLMMVAGARAEAGGAGKAAVRFKWRARGVGSNRISIGGPRGTVVKTKTRERLFARQRDVAAHGHQGTLRFVPHGAMKAAITTPAGAKVEVIGDAEGGKAIGNSLFSSATRVRVTDAKGTTTREFSGPGHRLRAVRAANRYLDRGSLD
jgi:hypothetical protein